MLAFIFGQHTLACQKCVACAHRVVAAAAACRRQYSTYACMRTLAYVRGKVCSLVFACGWVIFVDVNVCAGMCICVCVRARDEQTPCVRVRKCMRHSLPVLSSSASADSQSWEIFRNAPSFVFANFDRNFRLDTCNLVRTRRARAILTHAI